MKKFCFLILVFAIAMGPAYAQDSVLQIDNAVKTLAGNINRKLIEERALTVAIGQFTFNGTIPPLGVYLANQLGEELANMPNRSFTIISGGSAAADQIISGEIVEIAGNIRVYARLIRQNNRSVTAVFHLDFERNAAITGMLASGRGHSSYVPIDEYEIDSWENPVSYEIGENESVQVMNRSIHDEDDEDFFLLLPDRDGRLVMETTGDTDTYMDFFDAVTRVKLAEDDDGGRGTNARIRINVQAGKRYIAKVRGFADSTGYYGFRAFYSTPRASDNSWENPIAYAIGDNQNVPVTSRTINDEDDEDFFLLLPARNGRLVMETTGNIDTYMEFYNADTRELLDDDDDSGASYNARIRYEVQAGKRYIVKVRCFGEDDTGPYGFRAYFQ